MENFKKLLLSWGYRAGLPFLRCLPAEQAHDATVQLMRLVPWGFLPVQNAESVSVHPSAIDCLGLRFPNRVGLAAGFSKNAEGLTGLFALGFGFVEIGSVTPKPQPGNPRPRVFRLAQDHAIINRYGFNSQGHEAVYQRLSRWRTDAAKHGFIVGVNLGKNKDSEGAQAIQDYRDGVQRFADVADYLVINISSPNTPGLRSWQAAEALKPLLEGVGEARAKSLVTRSLLLKLAPDLGQDELEAIVGLVQECGLDGLIATNTTISRPASLRGGARAQAGGLSGEPLFETSTAVLKTLRQLAGDSLPIIGVGGITSVATAEAKIAAGANLVQLYTGLMYSAKLLPDLLGSTKP
jgi:dihydroorotate dehydrogenase